MKSVPNLISYLHEFFWNFSQFLAIYFELFSSGSKLNSENTDEWSPPVSRRFPHRAHLSARRRRVAATCPRRAARVPQMRCRDPAPASRQPSQPHRRCPSRAVASPRLTRAHPDRAVVCVQSRPTLSERATVAVRSPPSSRAHPR
jgi:hypothetical protein